MRPPPASCPCLFGGEPRIPKPSAPGARRAAAPPPPPCRCTQPQGALAAHHAARAASQGTPPPGVAPPGVAPHGRLRGGCRPRWALATPRALLCVPVNPLNPPTLPTGSPHPRRCACPAAMRSLLQPLHPTPIPNPRHMHWPAPRQPTTPTPGTARRAQQPARRRRGGRRGAAPAHCASCARLRAVAGSSAERQATAAAMESIPRPRLGGAPAPFGPCLCHRAFSGALWWGCGPALRRRTPRFAPWPRLSACCVRNTWTGSEQSDRVQGEGGARARPAGVPPGWSSSSGGTRGSAPSRSQPRNMATT